MRRLGRRPRCVDPCLSAPRPHPRLEPTLITSDPDLSARSRAIRAFLQAEGFEVAVRLLSESAHTAAQAAASLDRGRAAADGRGLGLLPHPTNGALGCAGYSKVVAGLLKYGSGTSELLRSFEGAGRAVADLVDRPETGRESIRLE